VRESPLNSPIPTTDQPVGTIARGLLRLEAGGQSRAIRVTVAATEQKIRATISIEVSRAKGVLLNEPEAAVKNSDVTGIVPEYYVSVVLQANTTRRRRTVRPIRQKPRSIVVQLAGSGTPNAASGSMKRLSTR